VCGCLAVKVTFTCSLITLSEYTVRGCLAVKVSLITLSEYTVHGCLAVKVTFACPLITLSEYTARLFGSEGNVRPSVNYII